MPFELRIDEALPDGIRRIAKKEIETVRECVDGSSKVSRDEMVHEARKSLKKLRALLRLVRPGVESFTGERTSLSATSPGR